MGIEDEDIGRVRDSSDIVAVISEHVQLKRVGRRWTGLCPFHTEKSPSFSVNQEAGFYYCFGCQAKGDVITFVREVEHLDFVGAVEKLAAKAGVALRYTDKHEGADRKRKHELFDAMGRAVDWYHERLLSSADAAPARKYLRSRGLTSEEVRHYRIGWAPDAWDTLTKALKLPNDVLEETRLGFLNKNNRQTDAFRGRVLFPIFDVNGNAVAFGGRILPGSTDPAKYKNSAESKIYAKSKTLYGLNWVKSDIVNADQAIVCEGYTDVIGFAAAGVPRAVATCGTALTEDHFRVLKSYTRRIVLAFDADSAGQNAAERFYEWERQYDIDVSVAALPSGVDPADLARSDPDALRAAVDEAVPFLGFRINRIFDAANLASPEGRARAAEGAVDAVCEHPNALVRDQYLMEIASRTRIDVERLRADAADPRRAAARAEAERKRAAGGTRAERSARSDRSRGGSESAPAASPNGTGSVPDDGDPGPIPPWEYDDWAEGEDGFDPGPEPGGHPRGRSLPVDGGGSRSAWRASAGLSESPELEALRVFINRRDEIEPLLHDALFTDEQARSAYRALASTETVRAALEQTDRWTAELLLQLVAQDSDAEPEDVLDLLIRSAANRELAELAAQAQLAEDPLVYAADMGWVKLRLEELREPATSEEARAQLVAWLTQQPEEHE